MTGLIASSSPKLAKNNSGGEMKSVSMLEGKRFSFLSDRRQVQLNMWRSARL